MPEKHCKICQKKIVGRSDKIFCSTKCKNYYHLNLRRASLTFTQSIDDILHRNHAILMELLGKRKYQVKTKRLELEKRKFNFKYHTHLNVNKHNKTYFHLYDFAYMLFSNDDVLIVRNKTAAKP